MKKNCYFTAYTAVCWPASFNSKKLKLVIFVLAALIGSNKDIKCIFLSSLLHKDYGKLYIAQLRLTSLGEGRKKRKRKREGD